MQLKGITKGLWIEGEEHLLAQWLGVFIGCGTQCQEQAVKKIITQVHMATTGPNTHDINPALYHAALLSPSQFCSALPNESTFLVIWDLGVSILVSYD